MSPCITASPSLSNNVKVQHRHLRASPKVVCHNRAAARSWVRLPLSCDGHICESTHQLARQQAAVWQHFEKKPFHLDREYSSSFFWAFEWFYCIVSELFQYVAGRGCEVSAFIRNWKLDR